MCIFREGVITNQIIKEWWELKRPMWSNVRVVIDDNIAFLYAKLTSKDNDRTVARIYIKGITSTDDLNPYEYWG